VKKPIEYPKQIVRVLYEHYRETGNPEMEEKTLGERAGIADASLYDALRIPMRKGWIEPGIEGQPCFTYITHDGHHSIVTLSVKGISVGQDLTQSRYEKVRYHFQKHLLQIIIGVVISVIATVIAICVTHFLFG